MQPTPRLFAKGLIFIAVLIAAGFSVKYYGASGFLTRDWIEANLPETGLTGELIFLIGAGLLAAVGLPRQVVSFMGGFAFGFLAGTVLALGASAIGCIVTFSFARYLGRELIAQRLPGRIKRIDGFLSNNTFAATLLIRLMPLGSNLITNLAAGVSSVKPVTFVVGSVTGYIPQTVIFALLGSGIAIDPELRITLSVILFLMSAGLGVYLYRKYRRDRNGTGDAEFADG